MRFDRVDHPVADDRDPWTGLGHDDIEYVGETNQDHRQTDVAAHVTPPSRNSISQTMVEGGIAAIADLDRIVDPRERLEQLIARALASDEADEATRFGHAFPLAVSDAADDPIVQPVLRRVSERRIGCLIACFRALGLSADEVRQRGLLAYAAYVGTLRLVRESPGHLPTGGAHVAYRRHLVTTLVPHDGS